MKHLNGDQKWAVLLCQLGEATPELTRDHFVDFCVNAGTGGLNDYWQSISHGNITLNGSAVYGWYQAPLSVADFMNLSRADKISRIAQLFSENESELDFSDYIGILVVTDGDYDKGSVLGGSLDLTFNGTTKSYGVVLAPADESHSFYAHEMGHAFGLGHSFDDSGIELDQGGWKSLPGEYLDKWDIMSAENVWSSVQPSSPDFGQSGPGLNAFNMRDQGWLDSARVVEIKGGETSVRLRPLSRPDLPGYLAVKVGGYLVEYRVQAGWDRGIPAPAVLIHSGGDRQAGGQSVRYSMLLAAGSGRRDLQVGDVFEKNLINPKFVESYKIEVLEINTGNNQDQFAEVNITYEHSQIREPHQGILQWLIDGVIGLGPNGKIVKVPPRQPVKDILVSLAIHELADQIGEDRPREAIQRASADSISRATRRLSRLR